jgi:hypothetical protein
LRWGELASLQVGDRVSVPGPGLRLTRTVLASGGGGSLYEDTLKNNRARTVPRMSWWDELVPIMPNGPLGAFYMAAIRPFRHMIVYPAMLRQIERDWRGQGASEGAAGARLGPLIT